MSVERRYSKRLPVNFPAQVRYRELRPFPGRASNLSMEGVYLEAENLGVPTGTMVELGFLAYDREWRIPALVVQAGSQGMRMMFREPQPDLYRAFTERHSLSGGSVATGGSRKRGGASSL
jgi:hypothetical protein